MAKIRQNGFENLTAAYKCANVEIDVDVLQRWFLMPSKNTLFECFKQFFTNVCLKI